MTLATDPTFSVQPPGPGTPAGLEPPFVRERRRDDWVRGFAASLSSLGALESPKRLAIVGRSLYDSYDLLDPRDVARFVWRRWPDGVPW